MKIISKHKDYYDYLQGIYGIDELMVYDRRRENLIRHQDVVYLSDRDKVVSHQFAICNKMWTFYEYKGKTYHTVEELVKLDTILRKSGDERDEFLRYGSWSRYGKNALESAKIRYAEVNGETNVNKEVRQPVLIRSRGGEFTVTKVKINKGYYVTEWYDTDKKESSSWSVPILKDFGLPSYYKADQLYQDISSFIAWTKDNPEIPNKQTDKEKLKSHGFDDKISFRHRKT